MLKINEAKDLGDTIDPKHEVEILCAACGFDLDESELKADTCSDCGQALILKQNILICATTIPAAIGSA
jgi:predicted RNA-binding Zn-ribbon protein involved in translation (DUF1610 family)